MQQKHRSTLILFTKQILQRTSMVDNVVPTTVNSRTFALSRRPFRYGIRIEVRANISPQEDQP